MAPKSPVKSKGSKAMGKFGVPLADRRRALARVRELQRTMRRPTESDIAVLSAGLSTEQIAQMNAMHMQRVMVSMDKLEAPRGRRKPADNEPGGG